MGQDDYTQLRITCDKRQKRAVEETARRLGISQATLVRDALAHVTQVPSQLGRRRYSAGSQGRTVGYAARVRHEREREASS